MSSNPAQAQPSILVADDQEAVRDLLIALLQDRGFHVVGAAGNGVDAVAQSQQLLPDVVLMDMRMPQMSGIEATRLIRERLPQTQVVLLSGHDDATLDQKCQEAGAAGWVAKGGAPSAIVDAVARACEVVRAGVRDVGA
jgi:DNA-binding NarL/FixJ family response regulator